MTRIVGKMMSLKKKNDDDDDEEGGREEQWYPRREPWKFSRMYTITDDACGSLESYSGICLSA